MRRFIRLRLHTLKSRLILSFLLVALVPTFVLGMFFLNNAREGIQQNYGETRSRIVQRAANAVGIQGEWVMNIANQIILDTGVVSVLERTPEAANRFDGEVNAVMEAVAAQYQYSPVSPYVRAVVIEGYNGADLRFGQDAAPVDLEQVRGTEWYRAGSEASFSYWGPPVQNSDPYSVVEEVIPLYVHLDDPQTGRALGTILFFFDPGLFRDCYEGTDIASSGARAYLARDGEAPLVLAGEPEPGEAGVVAAVQARSADEPNGVWYMEDSPTGTPQVVTWSRSSFTGRTVVELLPMAAVREQERLFASVVGVLVLAAVAGVLVLSFFLSEHLTRPVQGMLAKVRAIGRGQFNPPEGAEATLRPRNELGVLDASIDRMQRDIERLMKENVSKEREKRLFEMQMLQSQINPHFLYNTLNTVKLMAKFQGAAGIENMLVSLGRILRYALGETREKVTLEDELGVLQEFIHIQKVRYKGRIEFRREIPDERVLRCLVPRFILQPVAENAISHGLSGIPGQGILTFRAEADGGMLRMELRDNGAGIEPEKLAALREALARPPAGKTGSTTGGLGMANVHHRIRLLYGEAYGLRVESGGAGKGTCVTFLLNLEYGGEPHENPDH